MAGADLLPLRAVERERAVDVKETEAETVLPDPALLQGAGDLRELEVG